MKLAEIFSQLKEGELSQIRIGSGANGEIIPADYNKLINHVNLGLTTLFTRFNLKEGQVSIVLQPNRTSYLLNSLFLASNLRSSEPVKYLEDDSSAPFTDDVIKIERVLTDSGFELSLNNEADSLGVRTPAMTRLDVPKIIVEKGVGLPDEYKTDKLRVSYRAKHPHLKVGLGSYNPDRVEVALPDTHLWALLLFIASRVHNPIGMSNEFHAGNSYAAKFEQECMLLEMNGVDIDTGTSWNRARANGWA